MMLTDISLWGVMALVVLSGLVMGLLTLIDHKMLERLWRALSLGALQIVVIGACVWALYQFNSWWTATVFLLLMSGLMAHYSMRQSRWHGWRLWCVVASGMALGLLVGAGTLWLCLRGHAMSARQMAIPLVALLSGPLSHAVSRGLQAYQCSLLHTQIHRRYLLANGATHLESVLPSVRRAFRGAMLPSMRQMSSPLWVAFPVLLGALLLCGVAPVPAVGVVALVAVTQLVVAVITMLLTLWLADRFLFDHRGNVRP